MKGAIALCSLLLALLAAQGSYAQSAEGLYLALQGDGTASVFVDKTTATAYITDGGRKGAQGINGAKVGKSDVIAYLQQQNIRRLAITCSHPHADHMGGLEQLVLDPRLKSESWSPTIRFIDTMGAGGKSLYDLYRSAVGEQFADAHSTHVSAVNRNAFEGFGLEGRSIDVRNFKYKPADVGANVHDTSVVVQYAIGDPPPITVVDFDDASTKLVNKWAAAGEKADVIIFPHHGSRNNSIESLLAKKGQIGLQDIVITVNSQNRYLHPAPEVLERIVSILGPEHVFITDSDVGENVLITKAGVRDGKDAALHRARLRNFVTAQTRRYTARARALIDGPGAVEASQDASASADVTDGRLASLVAAKAISDKEARTLQGYFAGLACYSRILAQIDGKPPRDRTQWIAGLLGGRDAPTPDGSPLKGREVRPQGPSGGTGAYFEAAKKFDSELKPGTLTGGLSDSAARFANELARPFPTWGGVIIGNTVDGPKARGMEFSKAADGQIIVAIELANGNRFDYVDVTNAELWAAYNFVEPTDSLRARYPESSINLGMVGVVGLECDKGETCTVRLHPAFAGTDLGWSAIKLDDLLFSTRQEFKLSGLSGVPTFLKDFSWEKFDYQAVQWFDEKAKVVARDGFIEVVARSSPRGCLLRLRVFKGPNEDEQTRIFEDAFVDSVRKQATAAAGETDYTRASLLAELVGSDKDNINGKSMSTKIAQAETMLGLLVQSEKLRALTANRILKEAETVARTAIERKFASELWPASETKQMCTSYAPMDRINRVAKMIALLRWYTASSASRLPALPTWVEPRWAETPDTWKSTSSLTVGQEFTR